MAGLSNTDIAGQLRNELDGTEGGSLIGGYRGTTACGVRLADDLRGQLDTVASLDLLASGTDGSVRSVPLEAVGTVGHSTGFSPAITHRDGQRCMTVQSYITAGVLPAKVLHAVQKEAAAYGDLPLPAGYRMKVGRRVGKKRRVRQQTVVGSMGLLVLLLLATLVLSFNSFRSAAIITLVGALSVGLGQLSLFLFGYPLRVYGL